MILYPLRIGIDVAGPGEDETVVAVRRGPALLAVKPFNDSDSLGPTVYYLKENWFTDDSEEPTPPVLNVDTIGIGYYFARSLRETFGKRASVREINVSLPSDDPERFLNLKAQFYWGLRKRFKDGDIYGEISKKLIAQLASIRYKANSRGQIVIESKEDAAKRGVKSPDHAEAVMLAFAEKGAANVRSFQG